MGEGIRFVMDSSKIASKWIKESIGNDDLNLLKNYEKEWKVALTAKKQCCKKKKIAKHLKRFFEGKEKYPGLKNKISKFDRRTVRPFSLKSALQKLEGKLLKEGGSLKSIQPLMESIKSDLGLEAEISSPENKEIIAPKLKEKKEIIVLQKKRLALMLLF